MCLVFLAHPYIITVIHRIIEMGRVKDKCAVIENSCGYRAKKFRGRIIMNTDRIKVLAPFSLSDRLYLTSFLNVDTIFL